MSETLGLTTVIDIEANINKDLSDDLVYPFVEISGITSREELIYFSSIKLAKNYSLPLYMLFKGAMKYIGRVSIELQSIASMLDIYDYKFMIHFDENVVQEISLDTPEDLIRFIKL